MSANKRKRDSKPSTSHGAKRRKYMSFSIPIPFDSGTELQSSTAPEPESSAYCEKAVLNKKRFVKWLQRNKHQYSVDIANLEKPNCEFPDKTFNLNSDKFSIENIETYGRGVKTNEKIAFKDKTVFRLKPFAAVVEPPGKEYFCSSCHRIDASSFTTCKTCKSVPYCTEVCRDDDNTHEYSCGTGFDAITDLDVKLIIKMVFQVMAICEHGTKMKSKIKKYAKIEKLDETIPDKKKKKKLQDLDCIMRLCRKKCDDQMCEKAERAYYYMKSFKTVEEFFEKGGDECLPYLLKHFLGIVEANAFNSPLKTQTRDLRRNIIYSFGSFFNHSCIPSLMSRTVGNELVLTALRNIEKDEQLTISYEFFLYEKKAKRQERLKRWGFQCNCDRCKIDDITRQQFTSANNKDLRKELEKSGRKDAETDSLLMARMLTYWNGTLKRPLI